MYILNMLFTLMQMAISNGNATELSTAAGTDPLPNLSVVINSLGSGYIEPRDCDHVRVRSCPDEDVFRFIIEDIFKDEESFRKTNLDNFWDGCPYGQRSSVYPWSWEVPISEAEKLLLWTLQRGQDIKCIDVLANIWEIA